MGHLQEDDVLALVGGTMDHARAAAAHRHLDGCGACRALVGSLLRADAPPAAAAGERPIETRATGAEAPTADGWARSRAPSLAAAPPPARATPGEPGMVAGPDPARDPGGDLDGAPGDDLDAPPDAPTPGRVFAGRYAIERELGRGGMGVVFAATDLVVGERLALKVMKDAALGDPDGLLGRELRLARRVTHRNVVRSFDLGTHGPWWYLTMELVEGGSLRQVIDAAAPLSAERVAAYLVALAEGLAAAHEAGVVHRDLKPSNVLVAGARVAISDFGISRSLLDPSSDQTRAGVIVGTPGYLAPEVLRGSPAGPAADLYALGVIGLALATGRRMGDLFPTDARGRADVAAAPPSRAVVLAALAGLPPALAAAIADCLAPAPDDRPAGARALAQRLRGIAAQGAGDTAPGAAPAPAPARGRAGVAVARFRAVGGAGDELAAVFGDELADRLCRVEGLDVYGASAVGSVAAAAGDAVDARAVGAALGVDLVVQGTLLDGGEALRVTVRVLDARSGAQLWSERTESQLGDVFELQDRIAAWIAELLRVDLLLLAPAARIANADMRAYLAARARLQGPYDRLEPLAEAARALAALVERAPTFAMAVASHADALVRLSFHPDAPHAAVSPEACQAAVDRALRDAPWLPETQLAAGRHAIQRGRYDEAAAALHRAVHQAPAFASALAYLGSLELEAGHAARGAARARLALRLNPGEAWVLTSLARDHALRGDHAEAEAALERLLAFDARFRFAVAALHLRFAVWRGDDPARAAVLEGPIAAACVERPYLQLLLDAWTGRADEAALERFVAIPGTPRMRSYRHQLAAELRARRGSLDAALAHVHAAIDLSLVDLVWLERCPALDEVRPRLAPASLDKVRRRAARLGATG